MNELKESEKDIVEWMKAFLKVNEVTIEILVHQ